MMHIFLCTWSLVALVGSTEVPSVNRPFVDPQHRFTIVLPDGWQYMPQPGDLGGVTFQKKQDQLLGHASVRVVTLPTPVALETWNQQVAALSTQELGFRLLLNQPARIADVAAIRRRFILAISNDGRLTKEVEEWACVRGRHAYLLHVETLTEMFDSFANDFQLLLSSFRPGVGGEPKQLSPRLRTPPMPAALIGRWQSTSGQLFFSPAGVVVLNGQQGTYQVGEGTLTLVFADQARVAQYDWHLDAGGVWLLILSGDTFGDGQTWRRLLAPAHP